MVSHLVISCVLYEVSFKVLFSIENNVDRSYEKQLMMYLNSYVLSKRLEPVTYRLRRLVSILTISPECLKVCDTRCFIRNLVKARQSRRKCQKCQVILPRFLPNYFDTWSPTFGDPINFQSVDIGTTKSFLLSSSDFQLFMRVGKESLGFFQWSRKSVMK